MLDSGPFDAKIMIVMEHKLGSSSESLLKQMLMHSGINFTQCYSVYVLNHSFENLYEDKSRKTPSGTLIQRWNDVRNAIRDRRPNIVIALGGEALRAITNMIGIEKWRGAIQTYEGVKVIATYNPAAVVKQYSLHPIVELDFSKAARESTSVETHYPPMNVKLKPSLSEAVEWLRGCKKFVRVSFDIETVGQHVRCISFARRSIGEPEAIVIPFMKFASTDMIIPGAKNIISVGNVSDPLASYWNPHDEMLLLNEIATLFSDPLIQKVGHNSISFDASMILDEFNMVIENHYMDTMHAAHLLFAELPMGLKFLTTIMTDYPIYWNKDTLDDMSEWMYNGMDSIVTYVISYMIEEELRDSGMSGLYKHINDLAIAITQVQRRGIVIDVGERNRLRVEQSAKLKIIQDRISLLVGSDFNPASPKQVAALLYDKMNLPVMKKKGKITTDEAAIKKLAARYPDEKILLDIIKWKKISKLISTFLNVDLDSDGRIRTSYNASGTKAARLSSSKLIDGRGMNLQNIPVGKSKGVVNCRHLFIPGVCKKCEGKGWFASPPGQIGTFHLKCNKCNGSGKMLLLKSDGEQAEARVVAEILRRYGDDTLYNKHKDPNFDVHTWMAAQFFNKPESKVTKKEREAFGKLPNHSGNYGAGPQVLVTKAAKEEIYGINFQIAKRILEARHNAIPGLRQWWADVERKLRSTRTLTTCFGRRRIFFGRLEPNTYRDAYSFEPQSIVGDITNRWLTKIELNPDSKFDILLQVHDEIVGELDECDLDAVVKEVEEASKIEIPINKEPLVIPVSIKVGYNWRDMVTVKEFKDGKHS